MTVNLEEPERSFALLKILRNFAHTDKSNKSFQSVKGILLFVCTHNNNKTLCFCKIMKANRVRVLPSKSLWTWARQKINYLINQNFVFATQTSKIYLAHRKSLLLNEPIQMENIFLCFSIKCVSTVEMTSHHCSRKYRKHLSMNNDVKAVFLPFFFQSIHIITAGVLWQALCVRWSADRL